MNKREIVATIEASYGKIVDQVLSTMDAKEGHRNIIINLLSSAYALGGQHALELVRDQRS